MIEKNEDDGILYDDEVKLTNIEKMIIDRLDKKGILKNDHLGKQTVNAICFLSYKYKISKFLRLIADVEDEVFEILEEQEKGEK